MDKINTIVTESWDYAHYPFYDALSVELRSTDQFTYLRLPDTITVTVRRVGEILDKELTEAHY
ncbi:MAG: hypothetical protein LBJ95_02555 [Oscillospiraceae bacterium]|nr:hypothetical protein [Oscillospiraceae bacterium]